MAVQSSWSAPVMTAPSVKVAPPATSTTMRRPASGCTIVRGGEKERVAQRLPRLAIAYVATGIHRTPSNMKYAAQHRGEAPARTPGRAACLRT